MKRGTSSHPKTVNLARTLDLPLFSVVGLLELLWHFTAKHAPQGNVGKWTDEEIADALCWSGDPETLIAALTLRRWLDKSEEHRLVVHDWHDHADDATKKSLQRNGLDFLSRRLRTTADNGGQKPPAVAGAVALPEPEPRPEPISASATATAKSSGPEPWAREAADDWRESKGGDPPAAIFAPLHTAVRAHGWDRVRPVWRYHLGQMRSEFIRADKFVGAFGEWEKRMQGAAPPGAPPAGGVGGATMAAARRVLARHEPGPKKLTGGTT